MTDGIGRRRVVQSIGTAGAALLAGCSSGGGGDSPNGTTPTANESESDGTESEAGGDAGPPTNKWLQPGHDAGHTNASAGPAPVAESFSEQWRVDGVGNGEIVADEEHLYTHGGGSLRCIAYDGSVEWENSAEDLGSIERYDDAIGYFGDEIVYLLDAETGDRITSMQTENPYSLSTLQFHDGLLVTGEDGVGLGDPWLGVTDVESGEELWNKDVSTPVLEAVVGDTFVASGNDTLAAYDIQSGSKLWTNDFEGNIGVADENTAFGTFSTGIYDPTQLFAHSIDEPERRWTRELPNDGQVVSFALDEETLYLVQKQSVSAMDRESGETNWTFNTTNEVVDNPLLTPSALYVHEEKSIEILDPATGDQLHLVSASDVLGTDEQAYLNFEAILAHGRLYVGLSDAIEDDPLLALGAPE